MFGKWGNGKKTLAAQIAIRLGKEDPTLKIKIVRDRDVTSQDLKSMHSTIIIIHDPVKKWFTSKHSDEIIDCLSAICTNAKPNNSYIIAFFHYDNWNSFRLQIGNKNTTMERMFPNRWNICNDMKKLTEMAKRKNKDISSLRFQLNNRSIGDTLIMTLYLKNLNPEYLSNPGKFIFEKLKTLNESPEIIDRLAFKTIVFIVLHNGEIAKRELDDISHHSLFADVKEKMNTEISLGKCIDQLLDLFIEETLESYCVLHEVITRCTFLFAVENYMTLLLTECDPILILDCIQLKSKWERLTHSEKIVYDYNNLKIALPTEIYPEIVRLFCQRSDTGMRNVLLKSRFYDDEKFKAECNKAKMFFTNTN